MFFQTGRAGETLPPFNELFYNQADPHVRNHRAEHDGQDQQHQHDIALDIGFAFRFEAADSGEQA